MAPEVGHEGERECERERERVERLVREGKVSEDEGQKLVEAIDDAERREASAAAAGAPAERPKRPSVFSRPAGLFLAGLAVTMLGVLVYSLIVGRAVESLPAGVGAARDAKTLSATLEETTSWLRSAVLWSAPLCLIGLGLIVMSIIKFIARAAVREAMKV